MSLKPIVIDEPFAQWGLDFIGMINPPSSARHKWILTTTNYFKFASLRLLLSKIQTSMKLLTF